MKRFGAALNDTALAPSSAASLQCDVDFFVRFIQANEGGEGLVVLIHGSCSLGGLGFELILRFFLGQTRVAPVLRKPYSRGVENTRRQMRIRLSNGSAPGPVRSSG